MSGPDKPQVSRTIADASPGQERQVQRDKAPGKAPDKAPETPFQKLVNKLAPPGPTATADNLRPLVEIRIENWRRAAGEGKQAFVNSDLSSLIADQSLDTTAFLSALIGNVVWAAACFTTGGAAFAISLAGIGIGAAGAGGTIKPRDTSLESVDKEMNGYLNAVRDHLLGQVTPSCSKVVEENPDFGVNQALGMIMNASLKSGFLAALENPPWMSEINDGAVSASIQQTASDRLSHFRSEINPIFMHTGLADENPEIIIVEGVGLALGHRKQRNQGNWSIDTWVSPQMHDTALAIATERWKAYGGWFDSHGAGPGLKDLIGLGDAQEWVKATKNMPIPVVPVGDIWGGVPDL